MRKIDTVIMSPLVINGVPTGASCGYTIENNAIRNPISVIISEGELKKLGLRGGVKISITDTSVTLEGFVKEIHPIPQGRWCLVNIE